jgi:hypothetical protein
MSHEAGATRRFVHAGVADGDTFVDGLKIYDAVAVYAND